MRILFLLQNNPSETEAAFNSLCRGTLEQLAEWTEWADKIVTA